MEKAKNKTKEVKPKGSSKKTKENDPGEASKNEAILKSKLKEKQATSESDTDDEKRAKEGTQKRASKGKLFGKKSCDSDKKCDTGSGIFRRKSKAKSSDSQEKSSVREKESTEKEIVGKTEKLVESKEEEKIKETLYIPSVKKPSISKSAEEKAIISEALHQIENQTPISPHDNPLPVQISNIVPEEIVTELKMTFDRMDEADVDGKQGTLLPKVAEPEDYVTHIIEDITKHAAEENSPEKSSGNEDQTRYL